MASARASATRWRWPPDNCDRIPAPEARQLHHVEEPGHARRDLVARRPSPPRPHREAVRDVVGHRHVPEQSIVLEHESDAPLLDRQSYGVLAVEPDRAAGRTPRPAMSRNSVVLPDPDGPRSASSSPGAMSRSTRSRIAWDPNVLLNPAIEMAWGGPKAAAARGRGEPCAAISPAAANSSRTSRAVPMALEDSLEAERDQGQEPRSEASEKAAAMLYSL